MASLFNWITELISPDAVANVATRLGESDASVFRGLHAAVISVLAGLVTKTSDIGLMRQAYDLASTGDGEINTPLDLTTTIARTIAASPPSGVGGTLLSSVFGGRIRDVDAIVARTAGFEKPTSGASILALAGPIVLGFLGPRIRDRGLGLSGFTSMLASQRDEILDAAPAGIRSLVDTDPGSGRVEWAPDGRRRPVTPARPHVAVTPPRNRWLWPAICGIAAVALLWTFLSRTNKPELAPTMGALGDSAVLISQRAPDSTGCNGRSSARLGSWHGEQRGPRCRRDHEIHAPNRGRVECQAWGNRVAARRFH